MDTISTEDIKALREKTGVSVMQCKRALEEAGGDMETAIMVLRKLSGAIAEKKADRETASGAVVFEADKQHAAVVTLRCETDFVAKNDDFLSFAQTIAKKALADGREAAQEYADEHIKEIIQKIGENIQIGEIDIVEGTVIGTYNHHNEQGAVVALSGGSEELARDIAMHVAAMKPQYLTKDDIPTEAQAKAQDLFEKEVAEIDKPEEIKRKIIQGKIDSYFAEQTLTEQKFVKNPEQTIAHLLDEAGVHVTSFSVYHR